MKAIAEIKRAEREHNFSALVGVLKDEGKSDSSVASRALAAIASLSGEKEVNKKKLGDAGACEAIVIALRNFGSTHAEIAEKGCSCIRKLASDADNRKSFGDAGACEEVIKVMKTQGMSDPVTAEQACVAVYRLGNGSDSNLEKLGNFGGCEAVVSICDKLGTQHANVAEHSCRAISCLILNVDNQKRLGQAGVCKIVVDILSVFGSSHPQVAEQVCAAIRRLAVDPDNRDQLGEAGGCEAVVKILNSLGLSSNVAGGNAGGVNGNGGGGGNGLSNGPAAAEQACVAIYRLAFESMSNASRLGAAGACEAVAQIARSTSCSLNSSLAEWTCRAISNLTLAPLNADRLGVSGVCEAVVEVLRQFNGRSGTNTVAEWACVAISNLAFQNADNSERMGLAGASHGFAKDNAKAAEKALVAISNLAYNSPKNNQRLGEAGVCAGGGLPDESAKYKNNPLHNTPPSLAMIRIAEQGCVCISNLSHESPENCAKLRQAGACEVVVSTLRRHFETSPGVSYQGCWAVLNLALAGEDRPSIVQISSRSSKMGEDVSENEMVEFLRKANAATLLRNILKCKLVGDEAKSKAQQALEIIDKTKIKKSWCVIS